MTPLHPIRWRAALLLACGFAAVLAAAEPPRRTYELPAAPAETSLKHFAEQAGLEVVFASDKVAAVRTNPVKGTFTAREAIEQMLAGTALTAEHDGPAGAIRVQRRPNQTDSPATPSNRAASRPRGSAAEDSGVVQLSPFEITAAAESGYTARETLAGTRFKTELKDVPSQVSVLTKEFLEDIAAVTPDEALRYSLNVENLGEFQPSANGEFATGVINTGGRRIRGVGTAGVSNDFFGSEVPQDNYNTERLSISSGPNAILFGNGNPSGAIDAAFLRANLQRPRHSVSVRTDNYGSVRGSADLNQPILTNTLGLRLAAMRSRQLSWREPGKQSDRRYFGTVTFRPLPHTTLRAYYEDVLLDQTNPRNTRTGDEVTPWIKAGRPAFNNGLVNPTIIDASNRGIFARNTSTRQSLIVGAAHPNTPYTVWGGNANLALPTSRYSANTVGPGSPSNQSGVEVYVHSLPYDESVAPFDVSVNGTGSRLQVDARILGFSFEQRLARDLFFQADYHHELSRKPASDLIQANSPIRADANLFLPDRVTPNPNFGRYYVETNNRVFASGSESRTGRAMLSYEYDFERRVGWSRWFGRHRAAGLFQSRTAWGQQQQNFAPYVFPRGVDWRNGRDTLRTPAYNTFQVRAYLSDPRDSATGQTYHATLPFDPLRTTAYTLPDGGTYVAGYRNPLGATSATNLNNTLSDGQVLAVQSFFLKGRLVTSLGWRRDRIRRASYITQPKSAAPNAAFESIFEIEPPENWSVFESGNTTTRGAVLHVFPWLSGFYNESSTWNPPTGRINPDDGTSVPGSVGSGHDYGIMLRLPGDRLSLRLNKYKNSLGPTIITSYRNEIVPVVRNIENTLIDRTQDGTINAPRPRFYDPEQGVYVLSGLDGFQVSKGFEFELVANPTREWRLSLSGARANATDSDIGRPWINFIKERAPLWAQHANLTGPDSDNVTIGTRYLGIVQTLNQMAQADGQKSENGREWRLNLVTRYGFAEGRLRGAFVGSGFRWRSPQVLGYYAKLVKNEFALPGAPADVLVPARESPINGRVVSETELFLGYSRRLGPRVNWRVQLNIRNLLDNRDPQAQRAHLTTGQVTVYAVPEPRSYVLTNTFTF